MDSEIFCHNPVLPCEVHQIILRKVLDFDTLLSCRLASKQLNSIATDLLGRRHARVKLTRERTKLTNIFKTYKDPGNLPWSSVRLWSCNVKQREAERLLRFYGAHVIKLYINPMEYNLEKIMEAVPNVEILNFEFLNFHSEFSLTSTLIRNLKSIKIEIWHENSFQLLKGLIEMSGSRLQAISITLPLGFLQFTTELVSLISRIPSISLTMNHVAELHPAFLGQNLRIRKLFIRLSKSSTLDFGPLQSLLCEASSTIEKFTLISHSPLKGMPSLSIPKLPKLRKLELIHNNLGLSLHRPDLCDMPNSFDYINGLTPNHFPVLGLVGLTYSYRHSLFEGSTFLTVHEAHLDEYVSNNIMLINWNQIFPNLKSLRATANKDTLQVILTSMTRLKELRLNLDRCSGVNVEHAEPNVSTKNKVKNSFEMALSSLPGMTELKVLELHFGEWKQVKGSTVVRVLLQIKRLETLALYRVDLPKTSKKKLMAHHSNVTFE